jgi:hypothetical protein
MTYVTDPVFLYVMYFAVLVAIGTLRMSDCTLQPASFQVSAPSNEFNYQNARREQMGGSERARGRRGGLGGSGKMKTK